MNDVAHLEPETIAAYRDGGLTPEERDRADDHLAECPECLGLLANTARTADAVDALQALLKVARAASHALKSYEYGNGSPDLARSIADALDAAIADVHRRL